MPFNIVNNKEHGCQWGLICVCTRIPCAFGMRPVGSFYSECCFAWVHVFPPTFHWDWSPSRSWLPTVEDPVCLTHPTYI